MPKFRSELSQCRLDSLIFTRVPLNSSEGFDVLKQCLWSALTGDPNGAYIPLRRS
jgi:hypothetical protein